MYADELLESGCPINATFAEYIKLSIKFDTHKKLLQPRKDGKLTGVVVESDGPRVDTMKWYQEGMELNGQLIELNKKVFEHPSFGIPFYECLQPLVLERGFIKSITCTASNFLKICDQLIWHESMTDEKSIKIYDKDEWGPSEWEVVKEQRPCPMTAHPVQEITITDAPHITHPIMGRLVLSQIIDWKEKANKYGIEFTIV
jgi:hypothetical protein